MPQTLPEIDAELAALSHALFGCDVAVSRVTGGGNSRVYRVDGPAGSFALKRYPDDGRGRGRREFDALLMLTTAGVRRVPRPAALLPTELAAAYTWVEGNACGDVTDADVARLADFAAELHALAGSAAAQRIGEAAEACFDTDALVAQIARRLERLRRHAAAADLATFLDDVFGPAFAAECTRLAASEPPRTPSARTLSPSDFGFHNALRVPSGDIVFLDFEYFGWDDPVKLVADVCWHPGMNLKADASARFVERCCAIYRQLDPSFERRLAAAFRLYGLRWSLIVLNAFLPDFWRRPIMAASQSAAPQIRCEQLNKARGLVARAISEQGGAPL